MRWRAVGNAQRGAKRIDRARAEFRGRLDLAEWRSSPIIASTGAFPRRGKNITVVGCYLYTVVEVARTIVE